MNCLKFITMSVKFDATKVKLQKYEGKYSENKLWVKIKRVAKKAGREVLYNVLLLFYALKSDKVTPQEKMMILGALGYFISPLDVVPDFIPVFGFSDDLAVLVFVLRKLYCVDESVKAQASNKLKEWFD